MQLTTSTADAPPGSTMRAPAVSVVAPTCGRPAVPTDHERNAKCLAQSEFVTANWDGVDERFTLAWREDSDLHFRRLAGAVRCRVCFA